MCLSVFSFGISPLVNFPVFDGATNVRVLAAFLPAAQQQHHRFTVASVIHATAGAEIITQFPNTLAARFAVAEISSGNLDQAKSDHLTDEARLKMHPAESVRTSVGALFRLEHGRSPEDLRQMIRALGDMLQDPTLASLRRSFTIWIKSLLRRKIPVAREEEINGITDFAESGREEKT